MITRRQLNLLFFLSTLLLISCEKIDDSIHYYLSFTHDATKIGGLGDLDETAVKEDADDFVRIRTKKNERFVCKIPVVVPESETEVATYTGPTPEELLAPLYKEKLCSYLIDTYWSYEVCHGKYVTQYHEEKQLGTVTRTEYYLGNYNVDYESKKSAVVSSKSKPPTRHIESEDYPYYAVSYTRGTNCDITGKPRTTDVVYICVENMIHKILSITEVSSCHYEIIIMTGILCKHPAYRIQERKDHEIQCYNEDATDEETAKPKSLQRLDHFHQSTFKREYTITHETPQTEEDVVAVDDSQLKLLDKSRPENQYKLSGKKRFKTKETLANNKNVVEHTVNSILTGKECIVGGQGWWNYEFCYGKQVIQFHQEPNGQRVEVMLGEFDQAVHNAWIEESPAKRGPQTDGNHITQVTHLYSKGDLCDDIKAHRSIEVLIRCQHSKFSALEIGLTLTEPNTCQYVLTIDSERFCEPLQYADDYGMIGLEAVEPASELGPVTRDEDDDVDVEETEENQMTGSPDHTEL